MNFFKAKDNAKKITKWLVVCYIAIIFETTIVVSLVSIIVRNYCEGKIETLNGRLDGSFMNPLYNYDSIDTYIILGSAIIVFSLMQYNYSVIKRELKDLNTFADSVGGKRIYSDTNDYRVVYNVVQEMAIASGTPMPKVYIVGGRGINSFVIGNSEEYGLFITGGALRELSREELQAVIAHEFSHIHNGDVILNSKCLAILSGMNALCLIGVWMMRGGVLGSDSRERKSKAILFLVIAGLIIYLNGLVASFLCKFLKSKINKEREYLADASAVQYTRNPEALVSVFIRLRDSGKVINERLARTSKDIGFMCLNSLSLSNMDTHPPIRERINRVGSHYEKGGLNIIRNSSPVLSRSVGSGVFNQRTEIERYHDRVESIDSDDNVALTLLSLQAIHFYEFEQLTDDEYLRINVDRVNLMNQKGLSENSFEGLVRLRNKIRNCIGDAERSVIVFQNLIQSLNEYEKKEVLEKYKETILDDNKVSPSECIIVAYIENSLGITTSNKNYSLAINSLEKWIRNREYISNNRSLYNSIQKSYSSLIDLGSNSDDVRKICDEIYDHVALDESVDTQEEILIRLLAMCWKVPISAFHVGY